MFNEEEYQCILHEIKNSVSLMGSSLQLIQKQHPEVKDYRYWDSTMSDLASLTSFFQEIAAARQCDNIQPKITNMNNFLAELQADLPAYFSNTIRCSFQIADHLPNVELDPLRMRHAVFNLLKNAFEAIDTSGQVILSAFMDGRDLCIQIEDNGCGMTETELASIYKPTYTSKSSGSGLGLPITKKIVEAHKGQLECFSTPHQGTTFIIRLPIAERLD